ncbi:MAG: cell envelope integrity protein CreD [Pseudomonadota bacterium]
MTDTTAPAGAMGNGARTAAPLKSSRIGGITSSPGFKFILLGFISLLLLLPTLLVWGVVEERSDRARVVASEIAQGWGGPQQVNGPYLVVPYAVDVTTKDVTRSETRFAVYSAESLNANASFDVNERRKSIYSTPLYTMAMKLEGRFGPVNLSSVLARGGRPDISNAFIAMGVSDNSGFRSQVALQIDGSAAQGALEPGLNGLRNSGRAPQTSGRRVRLPKGAGVGGGVYLPISQSKVRSGFAFGMEFALNGSRSVAIVPSGKDSVLSVTSNWPHPGFDGRFLPETRTITDSGFDARWSVPYLARGLDAQVFGSVLPAGGSTMQINFVEPLKFYQIIARTLKYAIAFFALIFLAVFILELGGSRSLHWIQYILVGLAMVVFYILLLALAEHVGFDIAYALAAVATTLLIALYVGQTLARKSGGMVMGSVIGVSYLIIYLVMKEQEFALLAGSIIAFAAIAITMYATRNVDWSGQNAPDPVAGGDGDGSA